MKARGARYTRLEKNSLAAVQRVLTDANAKPRDLYLAHLLFERIERAARRRALATKASRQCGPPPNHYDFQNDAAYIAAKKRFQRGIERLVCEEILDSADADLASRAQARKRLAELEQRVSDRLQQPVNRKYEKAGKGEREPSVPQAENKSEALSPLERFVSSPDSTTDGVRPTGEAPAREDSSSLVTRAREKPVAAAGETCSLCLLSKTICGCY